MKILWFSLSPCGSLRRDKKQRVIQGWMISLEDELKKHSEIELSVAFFSNIKEEPYEYDGVRYYPMYQNRANTKIGRVLERYKSMEAVDKKMLSVMIDVVKDVRPDLIHIHGTEERFGLIQNEVNDIPIVFSIQGLIAPYSSKYFSGFTREELMHNETFFKRLRGVGINAEYRRSIYKAQREIKILSDAKYVFGRTQWDCNICRLFNPAVKYFTVNEILREEFYKRSWKKQSYGIPFTILSTLSPGPIYKGFETLLETAYLLKRFSGISFKWYVAGYTGDEPLVKIAERRFRVRSEDCNLVFCGLVNADKLSSLLQLSDIFCQVSHIENSPNSLCEAMLMGVPVVATNAGGTSSMLRHLGLLVQDGDPYAMGGAILRIHTDFESFRQLALQGRELALERHAPGNVVKELLLGYDAIIKDFCHD